MKRDIHLIFGRNVNRLRIQRGLTQNQVLALADLDRRHYQRIERGEENPTLKVIVALGLALDASWDDLMRGLLDPSTANADAITA